MRDLIDEAEAAGRREGASRPRFAEDNPLIILGDTTGPRRAARWREVVPWRPIDEAMRLHVRWKAQLGLPEHEVEAATRIELRGENGGEMRVLARPELETRAH